LQEEIRGRVTEDRPSFRPDIYRALFGQSVWLFCERMYGSFAREYMALWARVTEDRPSFRPYVYRAFFWENVGLF